MINAQQAAASAELSLIHKSIVERSAEGKRYMVQRNLNPLTVQTLHEKGFSVRDNSDDKRRSWNEFYIEW